MIDITNRVRVEAGKGRHRAVASIEHLLSTGYAKHLAPGQQPGKGWRVTKELAVRTYDAQGARIIIGQPYQYLGRDTVYYIYVLHAVRHIKRDGTADLRPRYVTVDHRPDEASAVERAQAIAAELPEVIDENGDGVIDFRDMPVVEVA